MPVVATVMIGKRIFNTGEAIELQGRWPLPNRQGYLKAYTIATKGNIMLKELKFVQGAVAKKSILPTLTHFRIENGTIRSFNGTLALSTPIALDLDCIPKAVPFIKAIQNSKDTVTLSLTATGRLRVVSGPFKAFIDCVTEETPHVFPEGEIVEMDGDALLRGFKLLDPFIGDDASRPWSNGIMLDGESMFATNNVSLVEYWTGSFFPMVCNVPRAAIKEVIRINEPPIHAQLAKTSITFHYPDGKWVRSALLSIDWPDVKTMLNIDADPQPLVDEFFLGLETIKPFCDSLGRIYLQGDEMHTTLEKGEGASFQVAGMSINGVYQSHILGLLKGSVNSIDFSKYPKACPFFGDKMRGVIIGMRA